jgi:urease accessory protein
MAMAGRTVMIMGNMITLYRGTEMTATPAEHLLILQNWFSPAFPVGAFSYSGGLETAIARGAVHDRDSLADWLTVSLLNGTAFTDSVCLRAALAGGEVNELCLALCAGAERYQETTELGAAFANVMRETQDIDLPEGLAYPVAVGLAARALGLAPQTTLAAFLQGFCMNQISVAVRAVPIGQMEGQSCLRSLMPVIERALETVMVTSPDEMGSFALAGDLCALEHETAEQRIYRT